MVFCIMPFQKGFPNLRDHRTLISRTISAWYSTKHTLGNPEPVLFHVTEQVREKQGRARLDQPTPMEEPRTVPILTTNSLCNLELVSFALYTCFPIHKMSMMPGL